MSLRIGGFHPGDLIPDSIENVAEKIADKIEDAAGRARAAIAGFDRFSPERVTPPHRDGRMRITTYNVFGGPRNYEGVLETLRRADSDLVGLQEVSREDAERLARDLGMHMVFYGRPGIPFEAKAGKAILSRYPIEGARHEMYGLSVADHVRAMWRHGNGSLGGFLEAAAKTELMERRGVLEATVRVGARKIAFLDTHLTLRDAELNAAQLRELSEKAASYRKRGYEVVLVGDFNTNLAISGGKGKGAIAAGFDDQTDTVREFRTRYGKGPGNIGHPENAKAAAKLAKTLRPAWDATDRHHSITAGDPEMTPAEARALLKRRKPKRGSDEWARLTAAADGFTHLGANKRFDNVLVSPGLRVSNVAIDMTSTASDHQAVTAELNLRPT